jgi:hypothetical protein
MDGRPPDSTATARNRLGVANRLISDCLQRGRPESRARASATVAVAALLGTGLALTVGPATAADQAQLWLNQPVPVIAGGKLYSYTEFVNDHTRESLALNATTTGINVLQQASGDTLWTLP